MDPVVIRHAASSADFAQCVALQEATWGPGFAECVPATILMISQKVGGVTAGAWAPDGRLLGFVFGLTGVEDGAIVHWSDMLAVVPEAQGLGLGARLKHFQREALRPLGVSHMYWTFDPLVARNAHFNVNRLGARLHRYVPDMYGDTGSPVHAGIGTDRLVMRWEVATAPPPAVVGEGAGPPPDDASAPLLDVAPLPDPAALPPVVRVAIPADIFAVRRAALADAQAWRRSSRAGLQWALAHGYQVRRVTRSADGARCCYELARPGAAPP